MVSYVKESFDKDYYSSEELEASIDQAILDYNTAGGTENVKKKKFEVKDQNAELTMSYATGDDYSKFNQRDALYRRRAGRLIRPAMILPGNSRVWKKDR